MHDKQMDFAVSMDAIDLGMENGGGGRLGHMCARLVIIFGFLNCLLLLWPWPKGEKVSAKAEILSPTSGPEQIKSLLSTIQAISVAYPLTFDDRKIRVGYVLQYNFAQKNILLLIYYCRFLEEWVILY